MLIPLDYLCKKYKFTPKGVIHCGAHLCEEKESYDSLGIQNVVWIEGNPELYETIKSMDSVKNDTIINELLWEDSNKELEFKITNNSQSSSILDLGVTSKYHPEIHFIKTLKLNTKSLSEVVEIYNIDMDKYDFMNIDLQGVELNVLKGFEKHLKNIKYIYTEINTDEVYKNCAQLNELDAFLNEHNFYRLEAKVTEMKWGDAFYIKIVN